MNLFIDTTSKYLILILEDNNEIISDFFISGEKRHTEQTVEKIDELFLINKISWKNISAIYVTTGPGSYTGVRVSLTIAKTIKILNKNIKLFGINSLLYQLGKSDGLSVIFLANNKYYLGKFKHWKLTEKIMLITKDYLDNNKIDSYDYENFNHIQNYLNLKEKFQEIKKINNLQITY